MHTNVGEVTLLFINLGSTSLAFMETNEERKSHVNTPTAVNMLRFGSKNTPPPPTSPNLPEAGERERSLVKKVFSFLVGTAQKVQEH